MLATVHAYLNLKKNERGFTLGKIEQAIALKYPDLSMSDTKLSKIFKDSKTKVSIEELFALVDCMELDRQEILAILGEQEYRAAQAVDYKGTVELIADFERRETALRLDYERQLEKEAGIRRNIQVAFNDAKSCFDRSVQIIQENHATELQKRDALYERNVTHLKNQLIIDAEEYHKSLSDKDAAMKDLAAHVGSAAKSAKWWRFSAIVMLSLLVFAFMYVVWELKNLDKGATAFLIEMIKQGLI